VKWWIRTTHTIDKGSIVMRKIKLFAAISLPMLLTAAVPLVGTSVGLGTTVAFAQPPVDDGGPDGGDVDGGPDVGGPDTGVDVEG
jgi:hypothetical protein